MQKYHSKAINISDEVEPSAVTLTPNFVPLATSLAVGSAQYVSNKTQGQHLGISYAGDKHIIYEVPNGVSTKLLSGISAIAHSFGCSCGRNRYKCVGTVTAVSGNTISISWGTETFDDSLGSFSKSYATTKTLKINNDDMATDFGVWVVGKDSLTVYADNYIYLESGDVVSDYAISYNESFAVPYTNTEYSVTYQFGKAGNTLVVGDSVTATYSKFVETPALSDHKLSRLIRLNMIEEYDE